MCKSGILHCYCGFLDVILPSAGCTYVSQLSMRSNIANNKNQPGHVAGNYVKNNVRNAWAVTIVWCDLQLWDMIDSILR